MALITFFTRSFINFFGITQPTVEQEKRGGWFICGLLALILLFAAAVFILVAMAFGAK